MHLRIARSLAFSTTVISSNLLLGGSTRQSLRSFSMRRTRAVQKLSRNPSSPIVA
jgi:hypothetical protein